MSELETKRFRRLLDDTDTILTINKLDLDEINRIVYLPSNASEQAIRVWQGLGYEIRFKI